MPKGMVARISRPVLKWLIPARKCRFRKDGTGRNLDLLPCAGYRAKEMPAHGSKSRFLPVPSLRNLHLRAGISHFRTGREILATIPFGICYGERWVQTRREYCGCPSVWAKYWLKKA